MSLRVTSSTPKNKLKNLGHTCDNLVIRAKFISMRIGLLSSCRKSNKIKILLMLSIDVWEYNLSLQSIASTSSLKNNKKRSKEAMK